MKSPFCKMLGKRNQMYTFEDETSIEFLCQKNDCSLFCVGSHSKKRPHNLCIGRMFGHPEYHLLDMIELGKLSFLIAIFATALSPCCRWSAGVTNFKSIAECSSKLEGKAKVKATGAKPCMLFQGSEWEQDEKCGKLKNLLLDFFTGVQVDRIALVCAIPLCVATSDHVSRV